MGSWGWGNKPADIPLIPCSLKEPAGGSNTSQQGLSSGLLGPEQQNPNPVPGLRGSYGWAETFFPRGAPSVPQPFQAPAASTFHRLSSVWGLSLWGAGEGRGTQRCSDLPGSVSSWHRPRDFPPLRPRLPCPSERMEGGRVESEAPTPGKIQGPQRGEELKPRSEPLSYPDCLSTPSPPPHPLNSQFVFPSTPFSFFLFFSAHAHLSSNLSGN